MLCLPPSSRPTTSSTAASGSSSSSAASAVTEGAQQQQQQQQQQTGVSLQGAGLGATAGVLGLVNTETSAAGVAGEAGMGAHTQAGPALQGSAAAGGVPQTPDSQAFPLLRSVLHLSLQHTDLPSHCHDHSTEL
jgi:hypothetical protein